MGEEEIVFTLKVRPTKSWVDKAFIGNIVGEFLGNLRKETEGFEYSLDSSGEEERQNRPTTT